MGSWAEKIVQVQDLYQEIDRDVQRFHGACGFQCLGSCGRCCENPLVEATVLEMLPLAWSMVHGGAAQAWYIAAEQHDFSGRCIFFEPELKEGMRGHCGIYAHRPLVCRLFSSSGNRDKSGKVRLVVCAPIKHKDPAAVARAQAAVLAGSVDLPTMSAYVMRAMSIDPELEREHWPVNRAFKMAVDRVWIHQRFSPVT